MEFMKKYILRYFENDEYAEIIRCFTTVAGMLAYMYTSICVLYCIVGCKHMFWKRLYS